MLNCKDVRIDMFVRDKGDAINIINKFMRRVTEHFQRYRFDIGIYYIIETSIRFSN